MDQMKIGAYLKELRKEETHYIPLFNDLDLHRSIRNPGIY